MLCQLTASTLVISSAVPSRCGDAVRPSQDMWTHSLKTDSFKMSNSIRGCSSPAPCPASWQPCDVAQGTRPVRPSESWFVSSSSSLGSTLTCWESADLGGTWESALWQVPRQCCYCMGITPWDLLIETIISIFWKTGTKRHRGWASILSIMTRHLPPLTSHSEMPALHLLGASCYSLARL